MFPWSWRDTERQTKIITIVSRNSGAGSCHQGHVDAARLMLDNGAEVDRAMEDGKTPLDIAKSKGHNAVVALLEEHMHAASKTVDVNAMTEAKISKDEALKWWKEPEATAAISEALYEKLHGANRSRVAEALDFWGGAVSDRGQGEMLGDVRGSGDG